MDTNTDTMLWQNTTAFWDARYREGHTPWNRGEVSPRLKAFFEAEGQALLQPGAKIAVLGAGHGHEAAYLASLGFQVTAFDFSPQALEEAKALYAELPINWVEASVLALPESYIGQFDAVIEDTCFCAIHPSERPAYIESVHSVLAPTSKAVFIGVLWLRADSLPMPEHPPFRMTRLEVAQWFMDTFRDVRSYDFPELVAWSKHSTETAIQNRERAELLVVLKEPINSCYTGIKP